MTAQDKKVDGGEVSDIELLKNWDSQSFELWVSKYNEFFGLEKFFIFTLISEFFHHIFTILYSTVDYYLERLINKTKPKGPPCNLTLIDT